MTGAFSERGNISVTLPRTNSEKQVQEISDCKKSINIANLTLAELVLSRPKYI